MAHRGLKFGVFLAPFHRLGENPTLALDADILNAAQFQALVTFLDDYKLKAVIDVLQSKFLKRNISIKALVYGKVEPASGGLVRQMITVQQGISKEKAKDIIAAIKEAKLKVQAQIQDDDVGIAPRDLVESGLTDRVLDDPQHPYTQLLVASVLMP